ncbi:unnamed protein product [Acidocella sp. C78]|uniref:ABC transporter ATP-binding protein n=1 Tax=Acidocella sp. C78 TaxID=1671486 RepID=UPI00191B9C67|nr:ABC transporter ATP-binding protein [Acidocella sp. C78]CAG4903006.1 unnamed protein product [Acidocella sp. C78]
MPHLEIDGAVKRYAGKTVLHGIDLALGQGEFVSLLGPSGCGKTTLLRIVAGFERPDGGRVVLAGADITDRPAARRNMGMVFQAYSLFPNMTAEENVRFGLKVRRETPAAQQARAAELLALVGLAEHARKYPHQLSGGQQQRVALARALAIRPALLLLDEPLSALDAKVRVQLRDEIRRIQQETGVTTLFVTHDQEEALSISDRVVVMQEGRIAQAGTPAEIYGEPANIFVARFVGAAAELRGRVRDAEAGLVELCGRAVPAVRARGLTTGAEVHVLLRPETVRLGPPGAAEALLEGVVASRVFFGALTSIRIEIDGGFSLAAAMPSAEAGAVAQGSRVSVWWDGEAPRVLAAE